MGVSYVSNDEVSQPLCDHTRMQIRHDVRDQEQTEGRNDE
jgi:hypothetical protein